MVSFRIARVMRRTSGLTGSMGIGKMRLTEEETVQVERLLSRYEKKTASWPRKRWVLLAFGVVGLCIGTHWFVRTVADLSSEASYDIAKVIESDKSLTPENAHLWALGTTVKVAKIFELRQKMLLLASLEAIAGIVTLWSCACYIAIIVSRWNVDKRDTLICKVLRAKWRDEVSDEPVDHQTI